MAYPLFEEYQDALASNPREIFSDPVLASGQVVRQRSGEPLALSGNFALTYQVLAAGRRYAVRCFHKFCDALPQRYDAITRRLAETASRTSSWAPKTRTWPVSTSARGGSCG